MFDIGWTEMFAVIVVAVIVIGPKDLPGTLRTVGNWIGKVRAMGRDFQRGLDDMIRESELGDVKKQIEKVAKLDLKSEVEKTIDPTGEIKDAMKPIKLDADGDTAKKKQPEAKAKKEPEAKAKKEPEAKAKKEPDAKATAAASATSTTTTPAPTMTADTPIDTGSETS